MQQQDGESGGHPRYKTRPCRYFAGGSCKNGDGCPFLHDPNNIGTPADWGEQSKGGGDGRQMMANNGGGRGFGGGGGNNNNSFGFSRG